MVNTQVIQKTPHYVDLNTHCPENTTYFFLEHLLRARIALHLETGKHVNDAEVNIYLVGLLTDLISSGRCFQDKPYISSYDFDVRHYLDDHPGKVNEFLVYKENADFGLMAIAVFLGYEHPGSYHERLLGDVDDSIRIAQYYQMAASAFTHMKGSHDTLAETFLSISENIDEIIQIIRMVAADYFGFTEQISEGSLFHLNRELNAHARLEEYNRKIDDFLKLYGDFKKQPTENKKQVVRSVARELKLLNAQFCFDEKHLQP